MAYTGTLRPKGVPFSGLRYIYERVGISLVEVYERGGKSVISVGRKDPTEITNAFCGCEKVE